MAAFELEAVDYLTKPVRLERLQVALQKVERLVQAQRAARQDAAPEVLLIQDRGRTERVPLAEVLYFKAELKYITVRTAARSYILDASLSELEERYAAQFLRVHRNALVARRAIRALEKHFDPEEGEGWAVRLNGIDELLAVSRRQLSAVREALRLMRPGQLSRRRQPCEEPARTTGAPVAAAGGCRPGRSVARAAARAGERAQHDAGGAHGAGRAGGAEAGPAPSSSR